MLTAAKQTQLFFSKLKSPSVSLRQSLFYALLFAGTGASFPFIPLWLKDHGMNAGQVSLILAVPLLGRALTGPVTGLWADGFQRYRSPILILALTASSAYALMLFGASYGTFAFSAFLVLYFIGYTCSNNIGPLLDAMTLQISRESNFSYASARAWGSAAFILANVLLGVLLQSASTEIVLIWIICAALGLSILGRGLLLPHVRHEHMASEVGSNRKAGLRRLGTLFKSHGFLWLLLATGCLQAAHGYYYAFSTIIWQERGFSSTICGLLWAAAVVGEFSFLAFGTRLRHRLGPWNLLILASVAGVLRWALMMSLAPLWLLWPLQLLHGFTFAAAYMAGLELLHTLTPKGHEGLGQTVNSAYTVGLLTGGVTLVSGFMFDLAGARAYGVMAVLAFIGLLSAVWLTVRRRTLLAQVNAVSDMP